MPYALTFRRPVAPADREEYINECCIGGDVVLEQLLPLLGERYGKLEPTQEDWGWFLWFEHAGVKLAVDVFTNDATTGEFQLHLTSRKPRFLLGARVQDTPELEALRELVVKGLEAWPVAGLEAPASISRPHMTLQHQSHKERVDSGPGFDRLNTTRKASIKARRLFASASDAYRAELLGFDPQAEDDDDQ